MEKRERVTDANKTPLGRPISGFGSGIKSTSSSLLKPSYLSPSGSSYDTSSLDDLTQQVLRQAAAYPSSTVQHYERTSQAQLFSTTPSHPYGHGHGQQPAYQSGGSGAVTTFPTSQSQGVPTGQIALLNANYGSSGGSSGGLVSYDNNHHGNHNNSVKRENDDSNDSQERGRDKERKRKRRSRWMGTENEKAVIPGMPTILPMDLPPEQMEAYISQLQIEELTRKLRTGDLGIPSNPEHRSPSPEPIYGTDGKRLNTREYRTRKKLEDERHRLIQKLLLLNPEYKPPADYRAPVVKIVDRVNIPQEEHPEINFVGLLIGPRGNTLKGLEKDTGAKIIIRGKGSVKEGKVGGKAGHPLPGEDEPLHAYVTSNNPESVKKACDKIKDIIRQGIDMPESQNDLRKNQLRELALLNGTLREGEGPKCSNCGSTAHRTWHCPDKPNITNSVICTVCGGAGHIGKDCMMKRPGATQITAVNPNEKAKIDEEYLSLMAELGEGNPGKDSHSGSGLGVRTGQLSSTTNLFSKAGPMKALMSSSHSQSGHPQPPPPGSGHNNYGNHHSKTNWTQPPPPGVGDTTPPPPRNHAQPPIPGSGQDSTTGTNSSGGSWYSGYQEFDYQQGWNSNYNTHSTPMPPPPGMYWQNNGQYGINPPPPPPQPVQPPPPPPS